MQQRLRRRLRREHRLRRPDCFADAICSCKDNGEQCNDGSDNNCNGLIDCADPLCKLTQFCKCSPPGVPESCNNNVDDDCDGLVDCADPDCLVAMACQQCVAEICNDGQDNSCDGKIDCADPACFFAPNCAPKPEVCNNGVDDDNDGKIDCQDTDCANNPFCIVKQANCLSPKLIPGPGQYTGNTTGNISETKGQCGGDAGEAVFYFILTQPTKVHLDSVGTEFDSVLYVRTGACNSGKEIGCDDDSGGDHAGLLDFTILYPGTYYVFLDGYTVDPQGGANEGAFTSTSSSSRTRRRSATITSTTTATSTSTAPTRAASTRRAASSATAGRTRAPSSAPAPAPTARTTIATESSIAPTTTARRATTI
jgi:hypothetical protein